MSGCASSMQHSNSLAVRGGSQESCPQTRKFGGGTDIVIVDLMPQVLERQRTLKKAGRVATVAYHSRRASPLMVELVNDVLPACQMRTFQRQPTELPAGSAIVTVWSSNCAGHRCSRLQIVFCRMQA